jgi:peptide/nickel transport system substrate-binding protein
MRLATGRKVSALVIGAAIGLIAAACGGDNSSSSNTTTASSAAATTSGGGAATTSATTAGSTTTAAATTTTATPQPGGTITYGEFIQPVGLDPIVSTGHITTGALEMGAVYDTILRLNHTTGKYENVTAESLTNNADFTVWTLKLKPGIKFTDGTDYNADAVVFGMNRHRSGLPGAPPCQEIIACPGNPTSSTAYMQFFKDIKALDPLTVEFDLSESWSGFPYALASEPSMIPSPTALKQCDPTKSPRTCAFSTAPVGAGAFMVQSFTPGESIVMVKNPNYFGGQVYLDGIKFINGGDVGGTKTYDFFKAGTTDVSFLRNPVAIDSARKDKVNGYVTTAQAGGVLLMNVGIPVNCTQGKPEPVCTGKPDGPTPSDPPTKSLNVRKAVAAAIDPKVIIQRAYNGLGAAGSQVLQSDFRWFPNVPGPVYDPAAAKDFVAKAKAEGWDGKVRVLFNNAPVGQATGLAIDAMLKAAGIDSQLDITKDAGTTTQQYTVQHDFDIVGTGFATSNDEGGMIALLQNLSSTSPSNRIGFKDPVIDDGLKAVRAAKTDAERTAGYKTVSEELNVQMPLVSYQKVEQMMVWSPKVHGIQETARDSALLDKVWVEH